MVSAGDEFRENPAPSKLPPFDVQTDKRADNWGAVALNLAIITAYCLAGIVYLHWFAKKAKPWRKFLLEDFSYYVGGLDRAVAHQNAYADMNIGTGFLYPPPALLWTWLFARLSPHLKMAALFSSQALFLVLCLVMLYRRYGRKALFVVPLWCLAVSTVIDVYIGQVNLLVLLGLVTLFVFEDERPWLAGLALATIICLKLSPAIFIIYLLCRWRWRALAWTAAFSLAWCALTAAFFGTKPFLQYRPMMIYLSNLAGYGVSVSAYLAWVPHVSPHLVLVQKLVGLCSVLIVIVASLMSNQTRDRDPAFMAACAALIMVPGLVWHHQTVWLLLPFTLFWFRNDCSPAILMATFMIMQIEEFYGGLLVTHGMTIVLVLASLYASLRRPSGGHTTAEPAAEAEVLRDAPPQLLL